MAIPNAIESATAYRLMYSSSTRAFRLPSDRMHDCDHRSLDSLDKHELWLSTRLRNGRARFKRLKIDKSALEYDRNGRAHPERVRHGTGSGSDRNQPAREFDVRVIGRNVHLERLEMIRRTIHLSAHDD